MHILPLLADTANREVLAEWLKEHYAIVLPDPDQGFGEGSVDLCIVDAPAFMEYRDILIERKQAAEPRILPYLLIRQEERLPLEHEGQQFIDDIIVTPIRKRELAWRIETLFRMRELSVQVDQKNTQLKNLTSAVAHDLRNPLQVAQGFLQQLDGDEQSVGYIAQALNRMEHLIRDVLTVAGTTEGLDTDGLEIVDFPVVVEDCWSVVPTAEAYLQIEDFTKEEDGLILAKRDFLRQVLENLFRNAIEHGGDDVTVRVGRLPNGFYVEDDGPGIPAADRAQIFDEGHSTGAGIGLGLTIIQRVCEVHDWDVEVTDGRDGGARFEVTGIEFPEWQNSITI